MTVRTKAYKDASWEEQKEISVAVRAEIEDILQQPIRALVAAGMAEFEANRSFEARQFLQAACGVLERYGRD